MSERETGLIGDRAQAVDGGRLGLVVAVEVVRVGRRSQPSGASPAARYLPVSQPPDSGLHVITPMPWRWHVGRTSPSMCRQRIEYGGCSVCGPLAGAGPLPIASTSSAAGNVDVPQ